MIGLIDGPTVCQKNDRILQLQLDTAIHMRQAKYIEEGCENAVHCQKKQNVELVLLKTRFLAAARKSDDVLNLE
jgi:hypothetical protein